MYRNAKAGIKVKKGAEVFMRRNKVYLTPHRAREGSGYVAGGTVSPLRRQVFEGLAAGIYIHSTASGVVEENEMWSNAKANIGVSTAGA